MCDRLVFTCDIPVTMLAAADRTFANPVDGKNLLDLVLPRAGVSWRENLMCETYGHGYGLTIIGRMVTDGKWKYVCTEDDLEELYDLENDPYEKTNLSVLGEYQSQKQKMRTLLREKQRETNDPVDLARLLPKETIGGIE